MKKISNLNHNKLLILNSVLLFGQEKTKRIKVEISHFKKIIDAEADFVTESKNLLKATAGYNLEIAAFVKTNKVT